TPRRRTAEASGGPRTHRPGGPAPTPIARDGPTGRRGGAGSSASPRGGAGEIDRGTLGREYDGVHRRDARPTVDTLCGRGAEVAKAGPQPRFPPARPGRSTGAPPKVQTAANAAREIGHGDSASPTRRRGG